MSADTILQAIDAFDTTDLEENYTNADVVINLLADVRELARRALAAPKLELLPHEAHEGEPPFPLTFIIPVETLEGSQHLHLHLTEEGIIADVVEDGEVCRTLGYTYGELADRAH